MGGRASLRAKFDREVQIALGSARCDNGQIEIDNFAAELALRGVAIGRRHYLFSGADAGGEGAAAIYAVTGTANLNGVDPEAYLLYVLAHIADHPLNRFEEFLPSHYAGQPVPG